MSHLHPLKAEIQRRSGNTEKVVALFKSQPLTWIPIRELADVGGFAAWRTRVSEARQLIEAEGGSVEWNEDCKASAYMFKYVRGARLTCGSVSAGEVVHVMAAKEATTNHAR